MIDTLPGSTYKVVALRNQRLRGSTMHEPGDGPTPMRRDDYEGDYVEFWPAGVAASGRFSCAACGNLVTVRLVVPRCMLCGERLWERVTPSIVTELGERRGSY